MSAMVAIAMQDTPEEVHFETFDGDALIARSRSELATKFVQAPHLAGADVMVILDDDVQFAPMDLWKIVKHARERQALVGGIYVTRSRSPHLASMVWPGQEIRFGPDEPLVNVRYLATGFMAIPRVAFEAILEHPGVATTSGPQPVEYCEQGVHFPMWDFFTPFKIREREVLWRYGYEADQDWIHLLSEDWAFCERARQCGFEVFADPTIELQHRAYVSLTVHDLGKTIPALSDQGAPGSGSASFTIGAGTAAPAAATASGDDA